MPRRRTAKYRHYKPKDLGLVVIDGKAHYVGRYESPESWERYHRLLAEPLRSPSSLPSSAESGQPDSEKTNLTLAVVARTHFGSDWLDSIHGRSDRPFNQSFGPWLNQPIETIDPDTLVALII